MVPWEVVVRVRSLLSLSTGAMVGAGAMYLLDPEHGVERRKRARRRAVRTARAGAVHAGVDVARRAEALAVAAVAGYRQARVEPPAPAN